MISPDTAPNARPARRTIGIAIKSPVPLEIKLAAKAPHSARTAPTERSMPAVRITKVMPIAITALIEV
jgi:hypothetical protein